MGDAADMAMEGEFDELLHPGTWMNPGYYPDGVLEPPFRIGPSPQLVRAAAADLKVSRGPSFTYPTHTIKETHMAERQTKAQIEHELKLNRSLIEQLRERQVELLAKQKVALPAEPPSSCTMFTVSVRFTMRGKRYQFLVLRSGGQYWTTGTGAEHKRFDSWEKLCQWLEGPTVYDHTNLEILTGSGQVVDFNTGTIVSEDNQTPPY